MALDGYWMSELVPLAGIVSAFLLPISAFVWSTHSAVPFVREAYEAHFHRLADRESFYTAIALYVFAILWWPLELKRVRSFLAAVGHRRAFYECCKCVVLCLDVQEQRSSILLVDRGVYRIGRTLIQFSKSETRRGGTARQRELFEHAVRVELALDECVGRVLKEGVSELPNLVAMLMRILERLAAGRLLALLDDNQLPVYTPPSAEELEEETTKGDRRIVLWGATAAAAAAGVTISLGVPVGAVVPAALIFLMGPAVLWGSKKIGNPKDLMDAMRQGVTQPQESQGSAAAPDVTPASGGNVPPTRTSNP
ncbi:hypothetical protein [Streptomyces sp. TLI_146]|uniref:hypothetical protein n=1 Tax=Streptomyces sp. TLI_146 TaxID=1938858 RepID=UPI00117F4D12|nr:hypothetical protein [Streptomyces sp. TLI_146]